MRRTGKLFRFMMRRAPDDPERPHELPGFAKLGLPGIVDLLMLAGHLVGNRIDSAAFP
jgi:hypothetical protein